MSQRTYRKRSNRVEICLTQKEAETVKLNAKQAGLSLSEYTRRLYNGEQIVEAPTADVRDMIRQLKIIGSNINQIQHKLNVFGVFNGGDMEICCNELRETLDLICRAYRPGKGGE